MVASVSSIMTEIARTNCRSQEASWIEKSTLHRQESNRRAGAEITGQQVSEVFALTNSRHSTTTMPQTVVNHR